MTPTSNELYPAACIHSHFDYSRVRKADQNKIGYHVLHSGNVRRMRGGRVIVGRITLRLIRQPRFLNMQQVV